MKKFVACFLFSLLIFTNTSIAQPNFEISADKSYVEVPTLGSQFVEITIVNNQNFDDLFTFSVFPSSIYGISLIFEKNAIKVPAKSSASLYLMFSASVTAEEIPTHFRISATSSETGYSKQITILAKAKRTVPVYISGLRVDKYLLEPSETVNVFVDLTNLEEKVSDKFFVDLNLTRDGEIIHSERKIVEDIEPKSTKTITFSYTFDKYASNGTYYVRVSLKNVENREIDERGPIQLKLKGVVKLPTECTKKEVRYGLLTTEVLIEVKNEGNVPSGQFMVTESLPLIAKSFFIPEIEPDFENVVDGRIIYGWKVNNLEPGVSVVIRYKIFVVHFWVLILSIGLLLIYFFHMMFGLSIKKISPYKGPIVREKPIKIMINIKNKSSRQIKNVRVKDFVPAILKVLKKFDTLVPKIKREKDGTKLEWKIYALKPKEERIITYYVQPIVDIVGSIKLPEVIIEYKERNKKKIVKSRKSLIKSKIEEE